jgi:hypothetical protein
LEDFGLQISTTGDSINILFKELWLQNHCVKLKRNLAAFLKMLIPFIVVVPGIAAYVMVNDPAIMSRLGASAMENLPGFGTADRVRGYCIFTCRFKRFSLCC